jgi:hypothetical protein
MTTTPNFRRILTELSQGNILIPVIRAELHDPKFKGFPLKVEGWTPRPYDGWFHPSTHPTWTARQLAYYLMEPDKLKEQRPDLLFVLSVTQGKFWHTFIQKVLLDNGILVKDEMPLVDPLHNRRGHADGLLRTDELFEFKTMSDRLIGKVKTAEDVRNLHFDYWAQTQDYLDMSGKRYMRYLIMSLASPFPMQELVVEADPIFQMAQRQKYRAALDAKESGVLPSPCCAIYSTESKTCPTRRACPIGSKG